MQIYLVYYFKTLNYYISIMLTKVSSVLPYEFSSLKFGSTVQRRSTNV